MFKFDFDIDDPIDDPDSGVVIQDSRQENGDKDPFPPEAPSAEISIDDLVRVFAFCQTGTCSWCHNVSSLIHSPR